jgi:hypothetical protein
VRYTSGPKPLQPFMAVVPYRLAMNLAFSAAVGFVAHKANSASAGSGGDVTAHGADTAPQISALSWALILAAFGVQQVVMNVMFVSQMAFFARVSEPRIGGTYMTLLNTIANLGGPPPPPFPNRAHASAVLFSPACSWSSLMQSCARAMRRSATHCMRRARWRIPDDEQHIRDDVESGAGARMCIDGGAGSQPSGHPRWCFRLWT